jgi:hypothetical protein
MIEDKPVIGDDGTLDTLVLYHGMQFRYSSDYRFGFDNDAEFLEYIQDELDEEIALELEYQSV